MKSAEKRERASIAAPSVDHELVERFIRYRPPKPYYSIKMWAELMTGR